MKTRTMLLVLAVLGTASWSGAHECSGGAVSAAFLSYGSGSKEFTDDELRATFAPLLSCLETWVEDGGEKDGVPIEEWAKAHEPPRMIYRAKAMELIDALVLLDAAGAKGRLGSWIIASVQTWPDPVKWNAWKTLADLKEGQAVSLLRQEARRATGLARTIVWEQLGRLAPETAAGDLEALGRTQEDYSAIGLALLSVESPSIVPALERLTRLDPGKASRYQSRVRELQLSQR